MAMSDNPFTQYGQLQETGARNNLFDMRMMSAANRMDAMPRTRYASGRGGIGDNPMLAAMIGQDANMPDYSAFTQDPNARFAAQQYLKQFGLSPLAPEQVQQNAFLPNTGFFGRHPMLSRMLESGMLGAAATRGSDTTGEGISNVIGGALEGIQARKGMINRQYARPFEAARMLEGMQDMTQRRDLQEAEIQHLRAENQKLGRPDHDFRGFPLTRNDAAYGVIDNTTGQTTITANPDYDPTAAHEGNPPARFLDTKEAEFKRDHPGQTPSSQDRLNWEKEWQAATPKPPQPPRTLGLDAKNHRFVEIQPGMDSDGITPLDRNAQDYPAIPGGRSPRQIKDANTWVDNIYKTSPSRVNQIVKEATGKGSSRDNEANRKILRDYYFKTHDANGDEVTTPPPAQQATPMPTTSTTPPPPGVNILNFTH